MRRIKEILTFDFKTREGLAWVLKDWPLKIGAFVTAVILWWLVNGQAQMRRILDANLFFQGLEANLELIEPPRVVQVTVQGPTQLVRTLQPSDLTLLINLKGIEPGERIIPLTPQMVISAVSGIQVVRIQQPQLNLLIDEITEREVVVQPQLVGQLAEGYQLGSVRVFPPRVHVRGPKSLSHLVKYVVTESISIHMQNASFNKVVTVGLPEPRWSIVEPRNVTVYVQIQEVSEELSFRVKIQRDEKLKHWRIQPSEVLVIVTVPRSKAGLVQADAIQATLDIGDTLPERVSQIPVKVVYPNEWNFILQSRIVPSTVMGYPR